MTLFETAPYQHLTLTGPMGVGKTTIGRAVAQRLRAEFYDLENEILAREGQPAESIRELFGEARLKALETTVIRDLTLRRHAVIVVSGPALTDETNRTRLAEFGPVLCLTCSLNEILRRVHVARGAWFHTPANRGVLLSRLKREWRVTTLDLPKLDTSRLSVDETIEAVTGFWLSQARM
ncbi:MAG: AAA family ATPase [Chloroflexi bacterium]|nr:AAA family ATPase [Chloroflexota bacterium]